MFDIGVNLTSSQLVPDLEQILERARAAGVRGMAVTGTNLTQSREATELCARHAPGYDGILCSTAGVHPHHASEWNAEVSATILALCRRPEVKAIGETGLDFNRSYSTPAQQLEAFEAQLQIAAQTGFPLFLHERDAFDEQIALLRQYRDQISDAVVHCFTGTREQLLAYLDLDLYIGITGWVCDERRGQQLAAMVQDIPPERLLIETDAPWLLPRTMQPLPKNRRNEPAFLPWVARKVAACCDVAEEEIARRSWANALRFFRLAQTD